MTYTCCCAYSTKTPDDGQKTCPEHVEFYSKNKFEKLVHLVGFIIRIYHDARSSEWQLPMKVAWKNKNIKATTAKPSFLWWRSNVVCNKVSVELAANNNICGHNNSDNGNRKYIVARLNYLTERYSHAEANVSLPPSGPTTQRDKWEEIKQNKERKTKKERKVDRGMLSNNTKTK